jgi:hypothetical protein
MTINIRAKGAGAEREVADALNYRASLAFTNKGLPFSYSDNGAQRNQLQTAVGGCDLTNTWGLAIEVKRQEALSIGTWWAQCIASAARNGDDPVLIFRQNKQKWRVIMNGAVLLPPAPDDIPWRMMRVEVEWGPFLDYYQKRVERLLDIQSATKAHQEATLIQADLA